MVWAGWKGSICIAGGVSLTPAEAERMAEVLIEHAKYARTIHDAAVKEEPAREACGRLLVGQGGDVTPDPVCQRRKDHAGPCRPYPKVCGLLLDIQYEQARPRRCERPVGHTEPCCGSAEEMA